jgi:hypothetical protein
VDGVDVEHDRSCISKIWLVENRDSFGGVRVSGLGVFESFL